MRARRGVPHIFWRARVVRESSSNRMSSIDRESSSIDPRAAADETHLALVRRCVTGWVEGDRG